MLVKQIIVSAYRRPWPVSSGHLIDFGDEIQTDSPKNTEE